MWRKNRANTTDANCKGVDLNRNFDVFFGGIFLLIMLVKLFFKVKLVVKVFLRIFFN